MAFKKLSDNTVAIYQIRDIDSGLFRPTKYRTLEEARAALEEIPHNHCFAIVRIATRTTYRYVDAAA